MTAIPQSLLTTLALTCLAIGGGIANEHHFCGPNPMRSMLQAADSSGQSLKQVMALLREQHPSLLEALLKEVDQYSACMALIDLGKFKRATSTAAAAAAAAENLLQSSDVDARRGAGLVLRNLDRKSTKPNESSKLTADPVTGNAFALVSSGRPPWRRRPVQYRFDPRHRRTDDDAASGPADVQASSSVAQPEAEMTIIDRLQRDNDDETELETQPWYASADSSGTLAGTNDDRRWL